MSGFDPVGVLPGDVRGGREEFGQLLQPLGRRSIGPALESSPPIHVQGPHTLESVDDVSIASIVEAHHHHAAVA